jgi:hypothetical protein
MTKRCIPEGADAGLPQWRATLARSLKPVTLGVCTFAVGMGTMALLSLNSAPPVMMVAGGVAAQSAFLFVVAVVCAVAGHMQPRHLK